MVFVYLMLCCQEKDQLRAMVLCGNTNLQQLGVEAETGVSSRQRKRARLLLCAEASHLLDNHLEAHRVELLDFTVLAVNACRKVERLPLVHALHLLELVRLGDKRVHAAMTNLGDAFEAEFHTPLQLDLVALAQEAQSAPRKEHWQSVLLDTLDTLKVLGARWKDALSPERIAACSVLEDFCRQVSKRKIADVTCTLSGTLEQRGVHQSVGLGVRRLQSSGETMRSPRHQSWRHS